MTDSLSGGAHEMGGDGSSGSPGADAGEPAAIAGDNNAGGAGSPESVAGAGGGDGGGAGSAPLAPGSCGIAHRVVLPEELSTGSYVVPSTGASATRDSLQRTATGFWTARLSQELGSSQPPLLRWLRVEADDTQALYAATFQISDRPLEFLNLGPPTRTVLVSSENTQAYWSSIIDHGATATVFATRLLKDYYDFRFVSTSAVTSFDGQRGLFTSVYGLGHGVSALIAPDGTLVGDVLEKPAQGSCIAQLPTDSAGALTWIDQGFHVLEMGAAGTVLREFQVPIATPPAEQPACPLVALSEQGFALLTYDPVSAWNLHRVARDGTDTVEVWGELSGTPSAFTVRGDTVLVLTPLASGGLISKRTPGKEQAFAIDTYGRKIAAEPGALFLDSKPPKSPKSPARREILEIRCLD